MQSAWPDLIVGIPIFAGLHRQILTILRQQHYAILTQLFSGRGLRALFVDTQSAMQSSTSTG
jgi:hypothetical protein